MSCRPQPNVSVISTIMTVRILPLLYFRAPTYAVRPEWLVFLSADLPNGTNPPPTLTVARERVLRNNITLHNMRVISSYDPPL